MLDEIAEYLGQCGVANVFKAKMPNEPDGCVCLYEYAGRAPTMDLGKTQFRNPGLQAIARDRQYADARDRIEEVYGLLHGRTNAMIGGRHYLRIFALQEPFPLGGPDANERYRLAVNFEVARQEA